MSNNPILYILMRSDMKSLNSGKAMAQAAHAANLAEDACDTELFVEWKNQAGGFGTTLVLDMFSDYTIRYWIDAFQQKKETQAGSVLDPTYPLNDGECLHQIPILTCGWVFGKKEDIAPLLINFNLYP